MRYYLGRCLRNWKEVYNIIGGIMQLFLRGEECSTEGENLANGHVPSLLIGIEIQTLQVLARLHFQLEFF